MKYMEEGFLNMDNILSGDDVAALFADPEETEQNTTLEPNEAPEQNNNITEVVDSSILFGDQSESVGDGNNEERKGTLNTEGSSPENKPNFYSSITDALVDDGVFPDLTEERIKKVQTPEDFRELINERIQQELDERQRRIDGALNSGVNADVIKQYEGTLGFLNSITPEMITEEGDRGDDLRRRLLLQDFMNKNFSQENAVRMIKILMESGEDIEQAKAALVENKRFFSQKYEGLLASAKAAEMQEREKINKQAEALKKDILDSEKFFGGFEVDKKTRQKAFENISKPVYKDPKSGEILTALQKYKQENENDFIKNVGLLFTLTDGFKDLGKIINPSAKKEVKRKMKDLENTLNNSSRGGGSFNFVGTPQKEVGKSFLDRGFTIDI